MSGRFAGKTAIVTGASRGIGLGIAQRLVDDGAKVVITARKQDALDAAVEQLGGAEHPLGVAGGGPAAAPAAYTIATAQETQLPDPRVVKKQPNTT
ncbi:SDR family NAD(P)-dependent oxidoreductase, partial [Nocardia cyriacigeorgica]|uniref:SDR family NAD(P)-dependent oxidoreductase n=1 Tax=Nocardia cyriacigeorgica TaxID=135487 RepID=UPI0024590F04